MVWIGPSKLRCVDRADAPRTSPSRRRPSDLVQNAHGLLAALPFGLRAQQVLLGDHFQNRPDILRHAAVHQHQAVLQASRASPRETSSASRMRWRGSRQPRLMPNSGSPSAARHALDQSSCPATRRRNPASRRPSRPAIRPGWRAPATSRRSVSSSAPVSACDLAGGAHAHGDQRRPAGWWRPPGASLWECR